jgi:acetyl-CoA C-acetyltransferase
MASGLRDKVALIGMGCTRFGERWDVGAEELLVEAYVECMEDAGIDKKDIQAAWVGTCMDEVNVGKSAIPASVTLRLDRIPVTRVENMCASGTESLRGAVYAVASGAYDICLAMGVEKLKDTGYGGLPGGGSSSGTLNWLWYPSMTAPGSFAQLASAYAAKHNIADDDLKLALAHVSAKSHANGALNPKAHLRSYSGGADHRAPAGAVRLLRRERRSGMRDRDHPKNRERHGEERSGHCKGFAACGQQRRRDRL